jgi:hypothetical protein
MSVPFESRSVFEEELGRIDLPVRPSDLERVGRNRTGDDAMSVSTEELDDSMEVVDHPVVGLVDK